MLDRRKADRHSTRPDTACCVNYQNIDVEMLKDAVKRQKTAGVLCVPNELTRKNEKNYKVLRHLKSLVNKEMKFNTFRK